MQKRRRGRPSRNTISPQEEAGTQAEEGQKSRPEYYSGYQTISRVEKEAEQQKYIHREYRYTSHTPKAHRAVTDNTATTAAASPILPAKAGSLPITSVDIPSTPQDMAPAASSQPGGQRKRGGINTPTHSPAPKKPKLETEAVPQNTYHSSLSPSGRHDGYSHNPSGSGIATLEPPVVQQPPYPAHGSRPSISEGGSNVQAQGNGVSSHSPVTPQTQTRYPNTQTNTTTGGSSSPGKGLPHEDLPPGARVRPDGKGRDPYNIETICKALNIKMEVWDTKLRPELTKIIEKHGLANQKVIPSNTAVRESAVDEWIANCQEWLNEPNANYRRIYAMDRLKCGMADIRRSKNHGRRGPRGKKAGDLVRPESEPIPEEPQTDSSRERSMSATTPIQNPGPLGPSIPSQSNPYTVESPNTPTQAHNKNPGPPPPPPPPHLPQINSGPSYQQQQQQHQHQPSRHHPHHPQQSYQMEYQHAPVSPDQLSLTIALTSMNRRTMLSPVDFMPNGEYSLSNVEQYVMEDLGLSLHRYALWYEGPHGKVFISNDRGLRNAVIYEAGRGNKYPKWELEPRPI